MRNWSRSSRGLVEQPTRPDYSSWQRKSLEIDAYRCLTCGWFVNVLDGGGRDAQSHSRVYGHLVKFTPAGELP